MIEKTFLRSLLIGNIFNSPEIRTVGLHAVLARVGTFWTEVSFLFCCCCCCCLFVCLFCFVFAMESLTLSSQSFSPDLCLKDDLEHAMANCFEALLGEFF